MAIFVNANDPQELLKLIKDKIKNEEIETWEIDEEGDFTHVPDQWRKEAWLRPHVDRDNQILVFGILGRRSKPMYNVVYAVYHGRFSEMLLTHFGEEIKCINISPKPIRGYDII